MVLVAIWFGAVVLITVPVLAIAWRRAKREARAGSANHIVGRLLADNERPVQVSVSGSVSTWNPSKPLGIRNGLYGPGVATYTLDPAGLVSLSWHPERGSTMQISGPIPEFAKPDPTAQRKTRIGVRAVVGLYLVGTAGGFAAGFSLAHGSDRVAIGVFSAVGGYVAAYVVGVTVVATMRSRQARKPRVP